MNIQESKTLDSLLKVIYKNLSQKQINKLSGKIKSIFKKKIHNERNKNLWNENDFFLICE